MHIRVLLSKYRTYVPCKACHGARSAGGVVVAIAEQSRGGRPSPFMMWCCCRLTIAINSSTKSNYRSADEGLDLCSRKFDAPSLLVDVGLGYLTLDRQSTHVQRRESPARQSSHGAGHFAVIRSTCSMNRHRPDPRDINRLIGILQRFGAATAAVVEPDPDVIAPRTCSRPRPGPGERGGRFIFRHPGGIRVRWIADRVQYLTGQKQVSVASGRRPFPENSSLEDPGAGSTT